MDVRLGHMKTAPALKGLSKLNVGQVSILISVADRTLSAGPNKSGIITLLVTVSILISAV